MLKFDQVSKKFLDDRPALDQVSFEIEKGELVLITGPSGSGKTTLLKLLTKELDPSGGEIYFGDQNLSKLKRSKIPYHRRKIGAVFQDYKLLPELNVWENIALALSILGHPDHEIEEKVTDLLKLVGLTDKAYLFPHQLSGGEAQRISIARALSTAPQVIFADEPTGNLDGENSLIVAKLLKKINELGTTVIVTTHDPVVIKYLDSAHKMTLNKGALVDENVKNTKSEKLEHVEEKENIAEVKIVEKDMDKDDKNETEKKEDDRQPLKVKKHWGFFGIFKRPTKPQLSEEATVSSVDTEDVEEEKPEVEDHIEVESEDLDEVAKPAKSEKSGKKHQSNKEKTKAKNQAKKEKED